MKPAASPNAAPAPRLRAVCYEDFDELLADAEAMARVEVRTLGRWSQGQIYDHIARALHYSIDDSGPAWPALAQLFASRLLRDRFLTRTTPAGRTTLPSLVPSQMSVADGLASLTRAVERVRRTPSRAVHFALGRISAAEWDQFSLRHAELHMNHIVPQQETAGTS